MTPGISTVAATRPGRARDIFMAVTFCRTSIAPLQRVLCYAGGVAGCRARRASAVSAVSTYYELFVARINPELPQRTFRLLKLVIAFRNLTCRAVIVQRRL